jgi:hypothetical protein
MSNPNNNKNFNDEALRINRTLKKENDTLRMYLKEVCENANEDIPHYSRTKHFNSALKTAMEYLHKEK